MNIQEPAAGPARRLALALIALSAAGTVLAAVVWHLWGWLPGALTWLAVCASVTTTLYWAIDGHRRREARSPAARRPQP